jgi:hypothetical protein
MFKHMQINWFGLIVIAVLALLAIFAVAHLQIFHFALDQMASVSWNGTVGYFSM